MSAKLSIDGKPSFFLGINYWSRGGGPRMWAHFDADRIRAELAQMRHIGLNVCRSFAFIPSFTAEGGKLSKEALSRLSLFLDLCREESLGAIPTALVGHMSGQNHDFADQRGRCLYSDPELLRWQQDLIKSLAERSVGHPAVVAFLASNEMPLWGGPGAPESITGWARGLREALRSIDPTVPFGLGDGVFNLRGGQNGFDVTQLSPLVDFLGPHTYYTDTDWYRQALNAEYRVRSLTYLDRPILFEEFGCSSAQCSEQNQALYYREVIHGVLSAGASGAMGWCYSDLDLVDDPPYDHHAFELGFGITRADGSEKPVCDELRAVANLLRQIDFPTLTPPTPTTAIIVPSYFNQQHPFSWEDRERMLRTLLQSYVMCVKSGIEAEFVPEQADLSRYQLLLAPSTQKLLAPTWRKLLEHAQAGATLYWSYFGGDYSFQPGPWCHNFGELTGCEHRLRYGCFDLPAAQILIEGADVSLEIDTAVGRRPYPRAYLPIVPLASTHTELLASDACGEPAITLCPRGSGQVLFCNHPIEYYLAEQADINGRDTSHGLYNLLAARARLPRALTSSDPAVQLRLATDCHGPLLWVINHSWEHVRADVSTPAGTPLHGTTAKLAEGTTALDLEPKQVSVYRLR